MKSKFQRIRFDTRKLCILGGGLALCLAGCDSGQSDKIIAPVIDAPVEKAEVSARVENTAAKDTVIIEPAAERPPAVTVPAPGQANIRDLDAFPGLEAGLKQGKSYTVVLDKCPYEDAGWVGQADEPLGRLLCGETYSLSYNAATQEWVSTGVDEYRKEQGAEETIITVSQASAPPKYNVIYIWGLRMLANEAGEVYYRNGDLIGTIRAD